MIASRTALRALSNALGRRPRLPLHCALGCQRFISTSHPLLGIVTFKLADIGEGIAEAELLKNYKGVGDEIEEMEPLCEVQSDKAAVEITSRYHGKIAKLYHKEGDLIKIGAPLCDIETDQADDSADAAPAAAPEKTEEKKEAPAPKAVKGPGQSHGVEAAPAVRALAKEMGVDLSTVSGTGKGGRITKEDVKAAASGGGAAPAAAAPTGAPLEKVTPVFLKPTETKTVQLKGFPKAMVKSMNDSLKVPQMNIGEEIDMTDLLAARSSLKDLLAKEGKKVTITPFVVKAISLALSKVPIINSKFNADTMDSYTLYGAHNISVAIDTPGGLVVPTIKNCESLSVMEIQHELMRLQQLAQTNKLAPGDLTGGTISLSNVGVIAGTYVKAVTFDGQAAIIALGRTKKEVQLDAEGGLMQRDVMNVAVSADHRHLDGATVARFVLELKNMLENPAAMLLSMR
uniref:Dihydrolipoamide acetyltransferase component of pyruvate dehydrogenase complex n=1 Tax=Chromera velia CCMP2878 TaxID=1169474 RepID=A0A0G4I9G8_9ALVE|mmetsp:Transcript_48038/g.94898  ORF Transcript_48038/g.94898 Transcript_48038/m.94898 type:complete len:458 (+) Transcript_48038:206-1579(+)|eukprot:Cvel_12138.t1-p1 / transcript=Cvel_12138.t1 / gene=Cvel_12138 / organism=Chromera_velia_CCMP2878 / gene_product=Lipoamide acyltransferase component of, putative / transcript_product=Lipoamide acyltransferase component of, putative / location=Cvel_scaffold782:23074-28003(+) / protein_length=457 / sequence_SO=supercontig / SO=protein_coding / is_pseudo=false